MTLNGNVTPTDRAGRRRRTGTARPQRRGSALVLAAAVLWGTTGTAQRLAGPLADPLTVGAVRLAVGGLALLGVAAWRGALAGAGSWRWGAVALASLCVAAYQPLFFGGVALSGVAVGTVVGIGSAPVMAGLLGAVVRRERPARRGWAATALALLGCASLAARGSAGTGGGAAAVQPLGVVLAVGAGTAYAIYAVVSKGLVERHGADGVTAVVFAGAGLLLAPALLLGDLGWLRQGPGLAAALHLGLVATAASYLLFSRGLALLPVGSAATLSLAEPATATLLGLVVLGERLSAPALVGLAAISTAMVMLVSTGADGTGRRA